MFIRMLGTAFVVAMMCVAQVYAVDVKLAWDANTETNLAGYKVYWGTTSRSYGPPVNAGNQTAYTVTGLLPGTYYFAVTAIDSEGNESGYSIEVSITLTMAAPTATVTSPADGTNTSVPGSLLVSANATAASGLSIAGVTLLVNGQLRGAEDQSSPYVFFLDISTLTIASHTVSVRARDSAGNTADAVPVTINVTRSKCDCDGNNVIDSRDLDRLVDIMLGIINSLDGDIDGDGFVDSTDLTILIDLIVGFIITCPF